MDWTKQINQFEPLTAARVDRFSSPGDVKRAIETYNRAIINYKQNSQDMAVIALRRLAVSYPEFAQPALLLGFILAQEGQLSEAKTWLEQAAEQNLTSGLHTAALEGLAEIELRLSSPVEPTVTARPLPRGASQILERTRRSRRVAMATDKERKQVMRQSDLGDGAYPVKVKEPFWQQYKVRLVLPFAVVILITAILVGTVVWLFTRRGEDRVSEKRLSWLLNEISLLSDQNSDISNLIDRYKEEFTPAVTNQPQQTKQPEEQKPSQTQPVAQATPVPEPTASPTPTKEPTPTPDPDRVALAKAGELLAGGKAQLDQDLTAAAGLFLEARALLLPLEQDLVAEDGLLTAGQIKQDLEEQIAPIASDAAKRFRLLAEPEFKSKNYQGALELYLKAYQLRNDSHGGGVAYYVGRCYQLLGDKTKAKPYFEYVQKNFAGRDIAKSATSRLKEMG